jgi:hypothetical protein
MKKINGNTYELSPKEFGILQEAYPAKTHWEAHFTETDTWDVVSTENLLNRWIPSGKIDAYRQIVNGKAQAQRKL